uniref:Thioredoxin domain-containing protein n=1 Tax=Ananas comosus var. bracteatus TaxID=296719 RepID=A0A6V7NIH5_ANACO|nr:unnamed protein product [Ananas comosus var. bracteatus]
MGKIVILPSSYGAIKRRGRQRKWHQTFSEFLFLSFIFDSISRKEKREKRKQKKNRKNGGRGSGDRMPQRRSVDSATRNRQRVQETGGGRLHCFVVPALPHDRPVFAEFAKKYPNVIFLKVDVDELKSVAQDWAIEAMPTFVFLKEGTIVDKVVGAKKEELQKKIEQLMAA